MKQKKLDCHFSLKQMDFVTCRMNAILIKSESEVKSIQAVVI